MGVVARDGAPGARWPFRAVNLGWVLVVPALMLAGAFDPLLRAAPAAVSAAARWGGRVRARPARRARTHPRPWPTDMGVRFLAVFAFMQTMHYVVWVGVLPRYAPEAAARFDARVPVLRGGRAWLLGGGARASSSACVFALDYARAGPSTRRWRAYHAYLEFPVLLALMLAYSKRRPPDEARTNVADAAPETVLGRRAGCAAARLPVRRLRDRAGGGAGAAQPQGAGPAGRH